jgi:hypothetical protein
MASNATTNRPSPQRGHRSRVRRGGFRSVTGETPAETLSRWAASWWRRIAALFLTTEAVIAEKPEKNPPLLPCRAAATWTSRRHACQAEAR